METVVVLTAEAARAITKDILHNQVGEKIPSIAKHIEEAAHRGVSGISDRFPESWVEEQKNALVNFFKGLGYIASHSNSYIYINWNW